MSGAPEKAGSASLEPTYFIVLFEPLAKCKISVLVAFVHLVF